MILEENYCPDFKFFEPSLNECKSIDELITKCSNLENSNHLTNREQEIRDIKIKNRKTDDKEQNNEDKFIERINKKSSKLASSKSRKNRINKKRKKNWVAIFIKGCSSGIGNPYDDDEDEQFDEENDEDNNLENNDSNNGNFKFYFIDLKIN